MSKKKTIVLSILSVILVLAIIIGILFAIRGSGSEAVNVYPVSMLATTDEYVSNAESYGYIRTDKMQPVYLSDTQKVVAVHVTEGQQVKKGDLLLEYDTTLTDLQLQKKDLDIQRLKLQIEDAYERLAEIKSYKPYVPKPEPEPEPEPEVPENPTVTPVPSKLSGIGTKDEPYRYLWDYTCTVTQQFITEILGENTESYVQFYVYDQNSLELEQQNAWGIHFVKDPEGTVSFTMYKVTDTLIQEPEPEPEPEEEPEEETSGFTAAEIAQMRSETEAEIVTLELSLRMAEVAYKDMEREMESGRVVSTLDGVVESVLDPEAALLEGAPVIKVTGGGGYYIEVAVGEFGLDTISVGQQVEVYSWETGTAATGEIREISTTPTNNSDSWSEGNTNISYYPFTVFVEEGENFREYEYVSVTYSIAGEGGSGIFVENPFVIMENGASYMYIDSGGVLEKREVQTGKSLWGSYIEIKSGLTMEDLMAFPYGKAVKEGAPTVEATIDALYGH